MYCEHRPRDLIFYKLQCKFTPHTMIKINWILLESIVIQPILLQLY